MRLNDEESAKEFLRKRTQMQRNISQSVDKILKRYAERITELIYNYYHSNSTEVIKGLRNGDLNPDSDFPDDITRLLKTLIESCSEEIVDMAESYADVVTNVLDEDDERKGIVIGMLHEESYGNTYGNRNKEYTDHFVKDTALLVAAALMSSYTKNQTSKMVEEWYRTPYDSPTMKRARGGVLGKYFEIPKYGRGIPTTGYAAIGKNNADSIAEVWMREEAEAARQSGAIGYYVKRGSSYHCPTCDSYCNRFFPISRSDMMPMYHHSCCCYVVYVDRPDIKFET